MKKALFVLLPVFIMVAFGAFAEGGSETVSEGMPYLELTHAWFFDGGSASDNIDIKVEWFTDYFGVDLHVNAMNRESYMESLALQLFSGDIEGMVELFGGPYMGDYYRDGATLDMAPYLENNANFKKLPEMMQETYVRDGAMQAIPTGWRKGMPYVRSIRKDWIDTLGLDMPETVYEFYDVIKAFTEDDPDQNGKDDTVGMTSSGVWMMADIFGAFGVPANHIMDHCITPDPHDGYRFNDGFLKPGMKACLEWLRDAYSNGYLDQEVFTNSSSTIRTKMYSGKYGTVTYNYSWALGAGLENQILKVEDSVDIDGIAGLTSDYAQEYVYAGAIESGPNIWALAATSKDPGEQVNTFVDVFLGSDVGFWSGYFGIYEKHWEFDSDGGIYRPARSVSADGSYTYFPANRVTRPIEGTKWDHTVIGYRLEGDTEEAYQDRKEYYQLVNDWHQKYLENKIYFGGYPHWWSEPTSDTYNNINADISRIFEEKVAAAITGSMTVDEAIASYRQEMKQLGAQKVLDEANAAIGKTSSTVYRY